MLHPLFHDIKNLYSSFSHTIIAHVYNENKMVANKISKHYLELQEDKWEIKESIRQQITSYCHESWF